MKINIHSELLQVTDSIEAYISKRLGSLSKHLKRFETKGEYILQIEVSRTTRHHRKGEVYYVEATLPLPRKTIRIEQYDEDLHAGIDMLRDRLTVELEKYKEKIKGKDKETIRNVRRGIEE